MLVKLDKIGEVHFRLFYSNSFHVKAKNERFTAAGSHCTKIQVVIWHTTSTSCTKKHTARAARLFFVIQPIKSLIRGDVEAVAVVVS